MKETNQLQQVRVVLATGSIIASRNKGFLDLYTNKGKVNELIYQNLSDGSKLELELCKEIEGLTTKLKIDFVGLKECYINNLQEKIHVIHSELEINGIRKDTDKKVILTKLKRYVPKLTNIYDMKTLEKYTDIAIIDNYYKIQKYEKVIKEYQTLQEKLKDGYLIPEYYLYGSMSGRIISHSPNTQGLPKVYKKYVRPLNEGERVFELDINSAEPLVLAFLTEEEEYFKIIAEGKTIYSYVAEKVFKKTEVDFTLEVKADIKKLVNGIFYGMAGSSVADLINKAEWFTARELTKEDGEKVRKAILNRFPKIKKYLESIIASDELSTCYEHKFQVTPSYKNAHFPAQNIVATMLKEVLKELKEKELLKHVVNIVHDSLWISATTEVKNEIKKILINHTSKFILERYEDEKIELVKETEIGVD